MSKPSILVIGDSIVDHYIYGKVDRISPEAPVPVVDYEGEKFVLGGASNVALTVAHSDIPCILVFKSLFGDSHNSKELNFVKDECIRNKIDFQPLFLEEFVSFDKSKRNRKVIPVKKRIVAQNQQLCRIDFEDRTTPDEATEKRWYDRILNLICNNNVKAVIMSDYNKGTLTDNLIQMLSNYCHSLGIHTILDPKRPSFTNIENLTIVKPNIREMMATGLSAKECSAKLHDTYVVNTLGKDGIKVYLNELSMLKLPTFAQPQNIVDVVSCGDSISALLGIALYHGLGIISSVVAANRAAFYCICQHGTYALNSEEINECLDFAKSYFYQE